MSTLEHSSSSDCLILSRYLRCNFLSMLLRWLVHMCRKKEISFGLQVRALAQKYGWIYLYQKTPICYILLSILAIDLLNLCTRYFGVCAYAQKTRNLHFIGFRSLYACAEVCPLQKTPSCDPLWSVFAVDGVIDVCANSVVLSCAQKIGILILLIFDVCAHAQKNRLICPR